MIALLALILLAAFAYAFLNDDLRDPPDFPNTPPLPGH
jgi:hypothetical protein